VRIDAISNKTARWIFNYLTNYEGKYSIIAPYLGMSVLDLGCGFAGKGLIPFLQEGATYVGVDVNQDALNRLRSRYPEYVFYCLDLDRDPLPDSLAGVSSSSIVLLAVIEHLKNPDFILDQCRSLMNDSTRLVITTPTGTGDLISRAFERMWGNPNALNARPHLRSFSKNTLDFLCKAHGLVCRHYQRLGWHRQNQLAIYTKTSALALLRNKK